MALHGRVNQLDSGKDSLVDHDEQQLLLVMSEDQPDEPEQENQDPTNSR